jgi:hypothetical protein
MKDEPIHSDYDLSCAHETRKQYAVTYKQLEKWRDKIESSVDADGNFDDGCVIQILKMIFAELGIPTEKKK